jgi:hypothetical protein
VLFSFIRLIYIIRLFVILSKYYSPVADRVSKMIGGRLSFSFALRCMVLNKPVFMIMSLIVLVALILGLMIYIIESPINPEYVGLKNCFWNIMITLTTVGYGDYKPGTTLGRFVIVVAALFGTIFFSITSMFIRHELRLSGHEAKVIIFSFRFMILYSGLRISRKCENRQPHIFIEQSSIISQKIILLKK